MRVERQGWKTSVLLLMAVLIQPGSPVFAQYQDQTKTTLSPPQDIRAFDTPSDGGDSVTLIWAPAAYDSAATKYQILLSEGSAVDPATMKVVAEFP
ncbi:MAG: hypothetical protein SCG74_06960, partial [Nitrospiraceae bacterium]|nr:hypothetical protein [Nitrospiraceae bacterium]